MGKSKKPRPLLSIEPSQFPPGPRFLEYGHDLATKTAIAAMNEDLAKHEAAVVLGRKSADKRRETPSPNPILGSIQKKLNRDWDISSADMVDALKAEADTDGPIEMSNDDKAFVVIGDDGKEKNRLAIKSVPSTISRLRKKNFKTHLTRTGSD
jgi:hypothetical protein